MGSTISIILRFRNLSNSDIESIYVYDFDSFDFGANLRPDKVFNGKTVPSRTCYERTVELSSISSTCPFTTRFQYKNGSEDIFRMNYKYLLDNAEANFRHLKKTHEINYKQTGPRVVEIIIQNTEEQIENQKAEQLISEGCKLMKLGKYNEASIKFLEAAQKANQESTVVALEKNTEQLKIIKEMNDVDKQAKTLNNEGLQLLKLNRYTEALWKFGDALKLVKNPDTTSLIEDNFRIAKDAKIDHDAQKLLHEGILLKEQRQNDAALLKFDEALRLALDINSINSIKSNKAETLKLEAERILEEAWFSEEAIHKFAKARYLLQEAEIIEHDPHNIINIGIINCKIVGEKHYNEALQRENEGSHLIDRTLRSELSQDCKVAKDKYEEAWKHYKKAREAFSEGQQKGGGQNFARSLELIDSALNGIEKILNELEKAELEIALV